MHRILSSSPESSSAASSFVIFFDFAFEAPFAGLGFGAGDEEALVCWPFVARPERRGSSDMLDFLDGALYALDRSANSNVDNDRWDGEGGI